MEVEVTAGFLVVKTFERMYRQYLTKFKQWWQVEHPNDEPILLEQMPGKYRGVARDPMEPWFECFRGAGVFEEPTQQELAANLFMTKLSESGKAKGFFIFALDDAKKLFGMIRPPVEREIIWARRMDRNDPSPPETSILGYEPIDFDGDFSSLIAHVLFFRYAWTVDLDDPDGARAKIHYTRLNKWGLFDTPTYARQYVDSFPLLPAHERPDHIAEIRAVR